MLRLLFHPFRVAKIGWVLARHDCLYWPELVGENRFLRWPLRVARKKALPARQGQRLSLALSALGPTFIKLGQALSTRGDVFGEVIAADLAELQAIYKDLGSINNHKGREKLLRRGIDYMNKSLAYWEKRQTSDAKPMVKMQKSNIRFYERLIKYSQRIGDHNHA